MADGTLSIGRIEGGCPCGFWAARNRARVQAQGLCEVAKRARVRAEVAEEIAASIEADRCELDRSHLAAIARERAKVPTDV